MVAVPLSFVFLVPINNLYYITLSLKWSLTGYYHNHYERSLQSFSSLVSTQWKTLDCLESSDSDSTHYRENRKIHIFKQPFLLHQVCTDLRNSPGRKLRFWSSCRSWEKSTMRCVMLSVALGFMVRRKAGAIVTLRAFSRTTIQNRFFFNYTQDITELFQFPYMQQHFFFDWLIMQKQTKNKHQKKTWVHVSDRNMSDT